MSLQQKSGGVCLKNKDTTTLLLPLQLKEVFVYFLHQKENSPSLGVAGRPKSWQDLIFCLFAVNLEYFLIIIEQVSRSQINYFSGVSAAPRAGLRRKIFPSAKILAAPTYLYNRTQLTILHHLLLLQPRLLSKHGLLIQSELELLSPGSVSIFIYQKHRQSTASIIMGFKGTATLREEVSRVVHTSSIR